MNLVVKLVVLAFELLVFVSLFRIQVVQTRLIREVDVLNLLLILSKFILSVFLLGKQSIQMSLLLVILVLDMHVKVLDIFWLRIASVFVKSQVVICQFTFELADIFNQHFVSTFKS